MVPSNLAIPDRADEDNCPDAASAQGLILNYFKAQKQFFQRRGGGLNHKAKVTMRKSYGFRTFRGTELALYHSLGKLPEPELTHKFY